MLELIDNKLHIDHLQGIPFEHGVNDCYTLGQRVFKDNFGLILPDYARPDSWWIEEGFDLYRDNFRNEGFDIAEMDSSFRGIRMFDVPLIAIPDPRKPSVMIPNHCAIYIGDDTVIHHRLGCLSEKRRFSGTLRNLTCMVIRHKDVPDLTNRAESKVDIMQHILPHKRQMMMEALNANK